MYACIVQLYMSNMSWNIQLFLTLELQSLASRTRQNISGWWKNIDSVCSLRFSVRLESQIVTKQNMHLLFHTCFVQLRHAVKHYTDLLTLHSCILLWKWLFASYCVLGYKMISFGKRPHCVTETITNGLCNMSAHVFIWQEPNGPRNVSP